MHSKTVTLVALFVAAAVVPLGAAGAPAPDVVSTTTDSLAAAQQDDCSFPVTRTDGTGTEVTVGSEPETIVTLGPSSSQFAWELGLEERVVGMPVNRFTAYLEGSANKTDVVNEDGTADQERIVSLQPDLVLTPNFTPNETVENLRAAGLTVYKEDFPESLDGIRTSTRTYGALTGACENATMVNDGFNDSIDSIRAATEGEASPRVFFYFFNFTAGSGTFTDELITTAGGTNAAAEGGVEGFKRVNLEVVAEQDPEVIVVPSGASLPSGEPWNSTTAFQEGNIVRPDSNLVQQPAPRVVVPMRTMQEAFAAAIEEETATPQRTTVAATTAPPTATPEPTPTETDRQTPEGDSNGDGAGFGVTAAFVAFLAAALLVARRD